MAEDYMSPWDRLIKAAECAFIKMDKSEERANLVSALIDVELIYELAGKGQIGNLVDESDGYKYQWRKPLTDEDKDAIVAAAWNYFASLLNLALSRNNDPSATSVEPALKMDALIRVIDALVKEKYAGVIKEMMQ